MSNILITVGSYYRLRNGYVVLILGRHEDGEYVSILYDENGQQSPMSGIIYGSSGKVRGYQESIYDVKEQPERPDRRKCYDFNVRRIRLVTTEIVGKAGTRGYNEILLYFGEGPADDPRDFGKFKGACVRTQYVEPDFKDPADGKVSMVEADFMDLPKLFAAKAAAAQDPGCKTDPPDESCPDPCLGAPMP